MLVLAKAGIDLKHLPALERRKAYVFVAIDRATRAVYIEIHRRRDAKTSAAFLKRFLAQFPRPVHTILTDGANVYRERQALTMGSEFTDRFAVDMKGKPEGKPSGKHPFDLACKNVGIEHRLTRPFRPQTNGMVERFNRRIAEAIGRQPKRGTGHACSPVTPTEMPSSTTS
jgi:transposase InsO family protein